jgi:hypothetical protein
MKILNIDDAHSSVSELFDRVGDDPVVIQRGGKAICFLFPAAEVCHQLAGKHLRDLQGAWGDLVPDDIAEQIAEGSP